MVRIQALAQQSCFPFADAAKDDACWHFPFASEDLNPILF
jgi:hypothetical protein